MFRKLFGRKEDMLLPWVGRESIYDFLKVQFESGDNTPGHSINLPDEEEFLSEQSIRWAAGAMDGVLGHHFGKDKEKQELVDRFTNLLRKQCNNPNDKTRRATYLALMDDKLLGYIDELLNNIRAQKSINAGVLWNEALWLTTKGTHRGVVKAGIALLGLFNCESASDILLILGRHDEFTLYVSVAIMNGMEDSENKLFELAKHVDGWGKIHIVERLEPMSEEIKSWLLTKGFRNYVMDEYLAYTCAVKGELHLAITVDIIDKDLYKGAGGIISALINGGPAEDIDDYEHSKTVIFEYLRHSSNMAHDSEDLNSIDRIKDFFEDEKWEERYECGWDQETREIGLNKCITLITNKNWDNQILQDLKSGDIYKWHCAVQAARLLKIDIWDQVYEQLIEDPQNSSIYFELMKTSDRSRISKLIGFAERELPLEKMKGEPKDEMGFGNEFKLHNCLDMILQDLENFEGIGGNLIIAGLNSPVVRNRNMALKALKAWSKGSWPQEVMPILKRLVQIEPNEHTKKLIEEVLIQ